MTPGDNGRREYRRFVFRLDYPVGASADELEALLVDMAKEAGGSLSVANMVPVEPEGYYHITGRRTLVKNGADKR